MIRLIVGDDKPDLVFEIERDGVFGSALTDEIESVAFKLRKPSGAIVTVSMVLVDADLTKYVGSFAPGDLDEAQPNSPQYGECIVDFVDGSTQHAERPFEIFVRDEYEDFG